MRRSAFTLIELLVVIAIIAILAAILFPVFAQAKLSAKGAATLSNTKQDALAEIMYETDFDDTFVLSTAWNTGNDPACVGTDICFSTWVWLVQPYQKNPDIDDDPMAPAVPVAAGWPKAAWISIFSTIGYDYGGLSPYIINSGGTGGATQVVSATALSNPSGMPMFSGKDSAVETTSGTEYVWAYFWNPGVDNGPMLNDMIERPYCNEALACEASWGYNMNTGDLQSQVDAFLEDNILAGARTGRCALRNSSNAVFSFADGHAKKLTPGAASIGTNFNINQNSDLTVITDPNAYLWTVTPGSY